MRYKRQITLPEIGIDGQEKIARTHVLCVGAGGLGSPVLLYLAAAGIGHIGIIDFDHVDESNLQRQILFTTDGVGQPKAVQAKERLQALNPEIEITVYEDELNAENAPDLFQAYDIILDGTDNFETKFLIND
ncbi:MAG: HesA/MoeB/ThiF family protein, partial [Alphaproteobacteria bacterium]|nr:HesA/MoeB/ThiF family protein [Alphaproteobacteria bacterium]